MAVGGRKAKMIGPPAVSRYQEGPDRKRRAHAKSRKGCGNCKLRRVKCDEARPECKKCIAYGVSCSYDGKASMDLSAEGSFQVQLVPTSQQILQETRARLDTLNSPQSSPSSDTDIAASMLNDTLELDDFGSFISAHQVAHFTFTGKDLQTFERFQHRTVMTIGTKRGAPIYRDHIGPMAFMFPFLMHMVLSVTTLHDSILTTATPQISTKYAQSSLHHWSTATTLFNRVLSRPIQYRARDALWATAALIGCSGFAYVESSLPTQNFPLKDPPEPCDLDWIKLSEGKKAVWKLVDPTRPDSIFHAFAQESEYQVIPAAVRENDTSVIPGVYKRVFNIDETSTIQNNAYHLPILILSRLLSLKPDHENALNFLYFMGYMTNEFRTLVETKDARALLILGWWLNKLQESDLWWMQRRAQVSGKAIQIWLERQFGGEKKVLDMYDMYRGGRLTPEAYVQPQYAVAGMYGQGEEERAEREVEVGVGQVDVLNDFRCGSLRSARALTGNWVDGVS